MTTNHDRHAILPVNPENLGQLVWRLHFDENNVYLEVNKHIPQIKDLVRSDRRFVALVYPEIVRQILYHILIYEGRHEVVNDDEDWRDLWLRYAIRWHPTNDPPPPVTDRLDAVSHADLTDWIDHVVTAFAAHHTFRTHFESATTAD